MEGEDRALLWACDAAASFPLSVRGTPELECLSPLPAGQPLTGL